MPKPPKDLRTHEAINEWKRWCYDLPRRYTSLIEMPMLVSIGFEYLCKKHGKDDDTPAHLDGHFAKVQQDKAIIDHFNSKI